MVRTIGKYQYPDRGTFKDALTIAKEAIEHYGNVIPYREAANKLGYNIKSDHSISGYIYRRFDDICLFGLMSRESKAMKTTDLAIKALDPHDTARAARGKAEAIRNIELISRVYDAWNGGIPSETAFPAQIGKLTDVNWVEAKKHVKDLMRLFAETFAYLKAAPEVPTTEISEPTGIEERPSEEIMPSAKSPWVEGKVGGVYIRMPRSKKGLETAQKLLELMATEIPMEETEEA